MGKVPLTATELAEIATKTVDHYNINADDFFAGTRDHDVSQNIAALLKAIKGAGPFQILDFGCGPGRDLQAFTALGHQAIGLEGSTQAAAIARKFSGCEVLVQDFFNLQLPNDYFDGIFANASLFHVPSQLLPKVLDDLFATLKPQGILFSSNPRGTNEEGWNGDRYGSYHDLKAWQAYLCAAGFTEVDHFYRPPGLPRDQQPWLASVWRK
ncbi:MULTISPECIES: bifunctional 2-polyprenyl-6-hydroxyphenol methylase/3-demethylubiquinol 3-O-methyltransferase UbiG [unclassified Polynucleobacter]|uniref:class I SAM-dependent methyltransferase n=1 Tax=unclassified Polynucleobacter TaxID=2640945 RepID=UPI001F261DA1|nr:MULTISPECIES: class I SAM-dependent methyltransferase [unclassified Polynucleobacter]MCE7527083.1 class I SAM-dependent methyltransferase [Polynucleobacter sp. IMCC 30228]MCE7529346.1 class I SAM-dependent methyltransferase [Polynucleobacter sp. IMCC 29146]